MTIELSTVQKVGAAGAPHKPVPGQIQATTSAAKQPERPLVQIDALAAARTPPIDKDRVAEIRNAVARGQYPITPMKVSDALIAASMLLNVAR